MIKPRSHAFWVILSGATPTSFRARERDTLVPTLRQLERTQPDVSLKWFERNQIWASPIEARDALVTRREQRPRRSPGWRPGGAHEDPRAKYKISRDEKRARFKKRLGGPRADPARGRKPSGSGGSNSK